MIDYQLDGYQLIHLNTGKGIGKQTQWTIFPEYKYRGNTLWSNSTRKTIKYWKCKDNKNILYNKLIIDKYLKSLVYWLFYVINTYNLQWYIRNIIC